MTESFHKPPGFLKRLYTKMLPGKEKYYLNGDFDELYNDIYIRKGRGAASLWYLMQIVQSLLPIIFNSIYWNFSMFKNHVKFAFRNIRRQKVYSFINITGLAVGMACTILILLWIHPGSYPSVHRVCGYPLQAYPR